MTVKPDALAAAGLELVETNPAPPEVPHESRKPAVKPPPDPAARADSRLLRSGLAFIWVVTGLGALHPYYQKVGHTYLEALGLPDWVMYAACAAEVVLGLWVAAGIAWRGAAVVQAVLIVGFTITLGAMQPTLLVDPYGALAKNLVLLAMVATVWLLERDGWTPWSRWLLRGGVASVWITEGLFAKVLFPQPTAFGLFEGFWLLSSDPVAFLRFAGACETALGVLVLALHG